MNSKGRIVAFTYVELALVVLALAGIILMLVPQIMRSKTRSAKIGCSNQLKSLGLAFRVWSNDHQDKLPQQLSLTNGGVMELSLTGDVAAIFLIMSNEINTPKILFCPTDIKRTQATSFTSEAQQSLSNSSLSYFVGLDAEQTAPGTFLSGDDNILFSANGSTPPSGTPVQSGILTLKTNDFIAWSEMRHKKQGNVGLADGSVQRFSSSALRTALQNTRVETNRLAMP